VMLGILLGLGDNEIALAAVGLAAVIGHQLALSTSASRAVRASRLLRRAASACHGGARAALS